MVVDVIVAERLVQRLADRHERAAHHGLAHRCRRRAVELVAELELLVGVALDVGRGRRPDREVGDAHRCPPG